MPRFNQELRTHWLSYLLLLGGLSGISFLFLLAWPDRFWLRVTAVILTVFYVLWGWRTHAEHGHVPKKIIGEYAGIGILGLTMLWLVTL